MMIFNKINSCLHICLKASVFLCCALLLLAAGCSDSSPKQVRKTEVTFTGPAGMTMSMGERQFSNLTRKLPQGRFIFKFTAPGHYPTWKVCTIQSGMRDFSTEVKLQPWQSALYVTSVPSGGTRDLRAQVFCDGKPVGVTPALITGLTMGKHEIKLSLAGHVDETFSVNVTSPRPLAKVNRPMISSSAFLSIRSNPSRATVFINGKKFGPTPWSGRLQNGSALVELRANGYIPATAETELKPGERKVLNIKLSPAPGSIMVTSDPAPASLFYKGKKIGTTPYRMENLAPGNYKLELRYPGFAVWRHTVEIKPGSNEKVDAKMETGLGSARLHIRPAGLDVFVNGRKLGTTAPNPDVKDTTLPFLLKDMAPGEYTCTVSHPKLPTAANKFVFEIRKGELTEVPVHNVWIENCTILNVNGLSHRGMLIGQYSDTVEFSPGPDIIIGIKKKNIKKITVTDIEKR